MPGWARWNAALRAGPYDLVVSNPPYVPTGPDAHSEEIPPDVGPAWAWNAGADGRLVLDPLCDGGARTARRARHDADRAIRIRRRRANRFVGCAAVAFSAEVFISQLIPFGPVLRARAQLAGERRQAARRPARGGARRDPGAEAVSANRTRTVRIVPNGPDDGARGRSVSKCRTGTWSNPTGSWSRSVPAGAARTIRCATPATAAAAATTARTQASDRRSEGSPAAPAPHQVIGQSFFHDFVGTDSENDVAVQCGLAADQITHHIGAHHLLVHRVGFDVFAVEPDAGLGSAHPLQGVDQPPRARRRGDLGGGEVADRRSAVGAVQAEQRHEVHDGQRFGGHGVDVTEVGRRRDRRRPSARRTAADGPDRRGPRRTRRTRRRRRPPWHARSGGGSPRHAGRPP